MNKQGFTLIELLIVIGIIGILAAVATTAYVGTMLKADRAEAYTNLNSLKLLEEQYFAELSAFAPAAANVAAIQAVLPGFQPGPGPKFTYSIVQDFQITGINPLATAGTATPCFIATATAIAGTRPGNQSDVFAIDCNNNKNF